MSSTKTEGEFNKRRRATTWCRVHGESAVFTEIGRQASYSKLAISSLLDFSAVVGDGRPRHSATKHADHNRDCEQPAHRQPCTTAIFDRGALVYTTSVSLQ
jgi:hypothetical protein